MMFTSSLTTEGRLDGDNGSRSSGLPTILSLGVVLLLLATGCTEPTPTATVEEPGALQEASWLAKSETPIRMTGEGAFVGQDLAPVFGPPLFGKSTFGGRCSQPSDFVIRFAVWGQAIHMGRVAAALEHCSIINFATGQSLILDGRMVITAPNGDELHAEYSRGEGQTQESVEFVGGTGRFTNAQGQGHQVATVDRATGVVTSFELLGT
ncbi:MAG: hypothetical protein HKN13_12215, partial [Rhodothermales bacterium]|nr:hypothetical protein [Rhodothermales bacterium]